MNTMEGASSSATRNSSRTSLGPSPRYLFQIRMASVFVLDIREISQRGKMAGYGMCMLMSHDSKKAVQATSGITRLARCRGATNVCCILSNAGAVLLGAVLLQGDWDPTQQTDRACKHVAHVHEPSTDS